MKKARSRRDTRWGRPPPNRGEKRSRSSRVRVVRPLGEKSRQSSSGQASRARRPSEDGGALAPRRRVADLSARATESRRFRREEGAAVLTKAGEAFKRGRGGRYARRAAHSKRAARHRCARILVARARRVLERRQRKPQLFVAKKSEGAHPRARDLGEKGQKELSPLFSHLTKGTDRIPSQLLREWRLGLERGFDAGVVERLDELRVPTQTLRNPVGFLNLAETRH